MYIVSLIPLLVIALLTLCQLDSWWPKVEDVCRHQERKALPPA